MNDVEIPNYAPRPGANRFAPARSATLAVVCGVAAAILAGAAAVEVIASLARGGSAGDVPQFAAGAAVLVAAAGGIFMLRHRNALLWILVLTAPFSDYLALKAGGLNVRPYAMLSLLGLIWIVWLLFTREKSRIREIAAYYKGTLALAALFIVSKLVTVLMLASMPPFMTQAFCLKLIVFIALQFAASFVVACFIETPEMLYRVLRGWIHVSNAVCFVAFVQLVLANTLGWNRLVWHREIISIGRPFSVFREPDVLGSYYAAFVVMLIPLIVARVQFVNRAYLVFALMAHALSLVLVVVRAAWIATAVCIAIYLALMFFMHRFKNVAPYLNGLMAAALLGVAGLGIVAPSVAEKIIERFASVSDPKAESGSAYRLMELKYQYQMIAHPHPSTGGTMSTLFGYGDFSWSYWAPFVIPEDQYDQGQKAKAKGDVLVKPGFSMMLAVQFDNGLAGLILYGVFFLAIAANFLRTLQRTHDPTRQALLLATFLPVVALLVGYQFSYDPLYLVLWILLGFHLSAVYHVNRAESGIDEIGIPEPA